MKKIILILSVLFFLSCKKETEYPIIGKWIYIATIENGVYTPAQTEEIYTFDVSGVFTNSLTGNGNYSICNGKLILNDSVYYISFSSKQIKIDNKLYFKSN